MNSRGQPAVGVSEVMGLGVMLTSPYSKKSVGVFTVEQEVHAFCAEYVSK